MSDREDVKQIFAAFCDTIAALRHPVTGCPWDLEQDHKTLRRYMIEEAYEAAEAMADGEPAAICDELGDVLLQVVLNAQIATDARTFGIADVIRGIDEKMRRRHPHVFAAEGSASGGASTVAHVRSNWEAIKAAEAAAKPAKARGLMADAGKKQPATAQALKIGKIAQKIRFDWDDAREVFAQVRSEVDELAVEIESGDPAKLAEEIGDVYFSLAQLCRHLGLDPETVSVDANRKFLRRFERLEALAAADGTDVTQASRAELEELWRRVKGGER